MTYEFDKSDVAFLRSLLRQAQWEGARITRLTPQQSKQAEKILKQLNYHPPDRAEMMTDPNVSALN